MTKGQDAFKPVTKNLPQTQPEDQNKPQNQAKNKQKKEQPAIKPPTQKPLQPPITISHPPLTSYRLQPTAQELQERKWQYLMKFQHLSSKAHYIHSLKYQTLFLAYSLAEKTISLVMTDQMTFEYWVVCCLFMSMKYEEIYPPRLKELQVLVKQAIKPEVYSDNQMKILEFIELNMNFVSLNTMLSEYLHAVNEVHRCIIFYLLQIALSKRFYLRNFTLREIVISVMFILSSHRLHLYGHQLIDGVSFDRIEECSKYIIVSQTMVQERCDFLFKKYKSDRTFNVAYGMIPCVESLTVLLVKKTDQKEKPPKIVGFCPQVVDEGKMVDESEEETVEMRKKKIPEKKGIKQKH